MSVTGLEPEVLTVAEVAAKLRLGKRTIYDQIKVADSPLARCRVQIGARKTYFSTARIQSLIDGEVSA